MEDSIVLKCHFSERPITAPVLDACLDAVVEHLRGLAQEALAIHTISVGRYPLDAFYDGSMRGCDEPFVESFGT